MYSKSRIEVRFGCSCFQGDGKPLNDFGRIRCHDVSADNPCRRGFGNEFHQHAFFSP